MQVEWGREDRVKIESIPLLRDNYAWLLYNEGSPDCAVVDPSEGAPVLALLKERGLRLRAVLATHHHYDHVDGIVELVKGYGDVQVYCSEYDMKAGRVPEASRAFGDGDEFDLLGYRVCCMLVPGHTLGALAYYLPEVNAVFTGDTLFTAGCGRLFEGTPAQMYDSLSRLGKLPGETQVYCGHEYTENNLRFAASVEGDNPRVLERLEEVVALRAAGRPTVPASMTVECSTNPFMRADDPALWELMGKASPVETFGELRRRKDLF